MIFDMAFGFRATASFVTDPAYEVPALGEAFPHTYTNANGYSANAGFSIPGTNTNDSNASNDPRLAGANYYPGSAGTEFFKVDLSSGSAPGTGDYSVDFALGAQFGSSSVGALFRLLDSAAVLIDGSNGGSGYVLSENHYIDATLTNVAASAAWVGTPVVKTFTTNTCQLNLDLAATTLVWAIAHFRLTKQVVAPPASGFKVVRRRLRR